ncbi:hypothetical protein [Nocardia callitridis]|uniref:hypothetical protein n=1 Tax=Nocardia callitridis TaxID=648753 RepID=UPI0031E59D03
MTSARARVAWHGRFLAAAVGSAAMHQADQRMRRLDELVAAAPIVRRPSFGTSKCTDVRLETEMQWQLTHPKVSQG